MDKKYFISNRVTGGEIKPGDTAFPIKVGNLPTVYVGGNTWRNEVGEIVQLPNWQERFDFQKVSKCLCTHDEDGETIVIGLISPFAKAFVENGTNIPKEKWCWGLLKRPLSITDKVVQITEAQYNLLKEQGNMNLYVMLKCSFECFH